MPDHPVIPFIEGDGIGVDITPVMRAVVDAAVANAYGGSRAIAWMEIYAGEKSLAVYGEDEWLPEETLAAPRAFVVGIKGPHDRPRGRWHPLPQRGAAPTLGPVRLPAAGALAPRGWTTCSRRSGARRTPENGCW